MLQVENTACFRLKPRFCAGSLGVEKTSARVDPAAFQSATNESALATPRGMLRLIRTDCVKCVESVGLGRRPCLRFGAGKSRARSRRCAQAT